jgi:hypothetical protein
LFFLCVLTGFYYQSITPFFEWVWQHFYPFYFME